MRFFITYTFLLLCSLVYAADKTTSSSSSSSSDSVTTSTSVSTTFVWVTGTGSDGKLATTQSPYFQSFEVMYTAVASPSAGSIGLGSLSGSIGGFRSYEQTTITQRKSVGRYPMDEEKEITVVTSHQWL
ncbi:hypothetical protein G210_0701 [Candida maltosa Xu316]|uniref:Uncharacterized protein n=1 Tax=Candida maltosa (strain Xu316) TaxID=1245528 RepID=M3HMM2_CANMX|nr:hypothetical protein G210_0701 [Candida maltosa Xu316]